jgi:hypothetical protein
MANIHHSAAKGFANSAATYVSGRPEYPREVDDWLHGDLGLGTGKAALDLGAGRGNSSPASASPAPRSRPWNRSRPCWSN